MPLISSIWKLKQVSLYEFEANLVFIMSSKTSNVSDSLSQKNNNNTNILSPKEIGRQVDRQTDNQSTY